MLNKIKLIAGVSISIAIIAFIAYVYILRSELETLKGKYEQAQRDCETYQNALKYESEKREIAEKTLSERMKEQDRIKKESEARLKEKELQLKELRAKYEEVNAYLNLPVPGPFLDWLREKAGKQHASM